MTTDQMVVVILEVASDPLMTRDSMERLVRQFGNARAKEGREALEVEVKRMIDNAVESIDQCLHQESRNNLEMRKQLKKNKQYGKIKMC